jgi:tryptophanyl-tRNA synthetase
MDETEERVKYGLVVYPAPQTADIILYKADTVPLGPDQLPHLERAREIVRRFNHRRGDTFSEPQATLTEAALIPGLDRQRKLGLGTYVKPGGYPPLVQPANSRME